MKQTVYIQLEPITLSQTLTLKKPEGGFWQEVDMDMSEYKDLMEIQLQRDQLDNKLKLKLYRKLYGKRRTETPRDMQEMRTLSVNKWINSSMQ